MPKRAPHRALLVCPERGMRGPKPSRHAWVRQVVLAAAGPVEALRTPLLDELEDLLGAFASLTPPARTAVVEVVVSVAQDPDATQPEREIATALLVLANAL